MEKEGSNTNEATSEISSTYYFEIIIISCAIVIFSSIIILREGLTALKSIGFFNKND